MNPKKVLFICHGHPLISPGGTEQFSVELYQGMQQQSRDIEAYLLVCKEFNPDQGKPDLSSVNDEPGLFFCDPGSYDYLNHRLRTNYFLNTTFKHILEDIHPHVVHFQHSISIGVQAISAVKKILKNTPVVYTLHEFIPICYNNGQMLTKENALCYGASPYKCNQCFPDISGNQFRLRECFIKTHFDMVDQFITPSSFLRDRFIAWGLAPEKIRVCENGRALQAHSEKVHSNWEGPGIKLGFFGQITPYKGLDILLKAMKILNRREQPVSLVIHGANLSQQPEAYKKKIEKLLKKQSASIQMMGAYKHEEMPRLLQMVDWVVVPSIWWENSPMVIQEAYLQKKPVICSNIGGMAEKVHDKKTGLHFEVNDPESLAQTIETALSYDSDRYSQFVRNLPEVTHIRQTVKDHINIYQQILER